MSPTVRPKIVTLIDRANKYLTDIYQGISVNNYLKGKALGEGVVGRITPTQLIHGIKMSDEYISSFPWHLAHQNLKDLEFGQPEIQEFLGYLDHFKTHPGFEHLGCFVSAMIEKVMPSVQRMELTLFGGVVHDELYYKTRGIDGKSNVTGYPEQNMMIELFHLYRSRLLLSYLGSYLSEGTLILNGNVGGFFAYSARGGRIILRGEAGWRPCMYLCGTEVEMDIAGHGLLTYGERGVVRVNKLIRSTDGKLPGAESGSSSLECYLGNERVFEVDPSSPQIAKNPLN